MSSLPATNTTGRSAGASGWVRCRVGGFSLQTDWDVAPGEVLVLFGPSGAGKTTTLRAIAGLVNAESGHIEIGGRVVYDSESGTKVPAHHRRVGYLTQESRLFPHLNVSDNIAYGASNRRSAPARARVNELVEAFSLGGLQDRYPWELSGGQQQRVALARALATAPEMLLLDEPFASLDGELRRAVRRELRAMMSRTPVPVMLVTHDREEALALGDSVQVIDQGRIVGRGVPLDVLGQPGQGRVARLVGVENLFRLEVESRNPRDGTMTCTGPDLRLEAPLDDATPDGPPDGPDAVDRVTIGLRASDIILSAAEPVGSSARNRLLGTVASIEPRPPGYTISLDCGQIVRCHITGASLEEMQVRTGQRLWAVFKASSCFLVEEAQE